MMPCFFALIGLFVSVTHAQALQDAGSSGPGVSQMWQTICSVLPCTTNYASADLGNGLIVALANGIIGFLSPLITVVAVCLVIYAGIVIVTSNGSEEKIGEAKKIIIYACAGVVLSLMTSAIIGFLVNYLGLILA